MPGIVRLCRLAPGLLAALLTSSCSTYNPIQQFETELELTPHGGVLIHDAPKLDNRQRKNGMAALDPFLLFWKQTPLSRQELALYEEAAAELYPIEEVMHQVLESRNLWSYSFYGSMADLEARLEAGQPLLVLVQDHPMKPESRRYMILAGFNRELEKLVVEEGGAYPGVYTYGRFRKMWRPVKNWMMEICPPDQIRWSLRMMEHVALARYRERRGQWQEALPFYDKALEQEPDNTDLLLAKADALFNAGQSLEAIAMYRQVLAKNELDARAANNLAFTLADTKGDLSEAEKLVRRALMIEPSNPVYMDTLGYILLKMGRARESADVLARARYRFHSMSTEDQRVIVTRLINAYLESNQPHLARQVLTDHLMHDPEYSLQDHLRQQIPR